MIFKSIFINLFLIVFCFEAIAQKNYTIIPTNQAPKIDGILNEECWQKCNVADNFVQQMPEFAQPSKHKAYVKFCYDNTAIYMSAVLEQPRNTILTQLAQRDAIGRANVDQIALFFDTYNDKQNGFGFWITAAGTQQDGRLMNGGSDDDLDLSWDAVWYSAVKINDNDWTVEAKIPFSALRIPNKDTQTWGLQIKRNIRKINEQSFWTIFDVNKPGFLPQEGTMSGLTNVKPPLRLFLFPYLSLGAQHDPSLIKENSFLRSGGMDVKYGINDAFTLDMTLVPDFSQVISDNLIRNLSPFEQQLADNRPFFTEGTELFNKQSLFYSRRVGSRPSGYFGVENDYSDTTQYEILKNPNVTTLYNASKLSGRTKNGTGLGIFNAVAAPMNATILDKKTNKESKVQTAPLTNYNMFVYDKTFKGLSYINFTNASTVRFGSDRDANVSGLAILVQDKKQRHILYNMIHYSNVFENNSTKTGIFTHTEFAKTTGKFKYMVNNALVSPNFDRTDLGIQFNYNHMEQKINFEHNNNTPKNKKFNIVKFWMENVIQENLIPFKYKSYEVGLGNFLLLKKSFWDFTSYIYSKPFNEYNYYELSRFNVPLFIPGWVYFGTDGSSDSRKKLYMSWSVGNGVQIGQPDWRYTEGSLNFRYLFNDHLAISSNFKFTRNLASIGRTAFYNTINAPLVGYRHNNEYDWQTNISYNVNPNLSFTGRYRHYNAFVDYQKFYLVNSDGSWNEDISSIASQLSNIDENFNLQNIDLFCNWIFTPGSRFVLSYKQWLTDEYFLNSFTNNRFIDNVSQISKAPKAFEVAARVIWFLDYNSLHKTKV